MQVSGDFTAPIKVESSSAASEWLNAIEGMVGLDESQLVM